MAAGRRSEAARGPVAAATRAPRLRGQGSARPIDDVETYTSAVLALLEQAGAGRWRLADIHLDEPAAGPAEFVPLEVRQGSVACVLQPDPSGASSPSAEGVELAHLAGRMLATVMAADDRQAKLRRRAERAERLALADALTELPNRRGWWDGVNREVARCEREQRTAVLAIVDLDDLKTVNDTSGHLAGDLLLVQAARALRAAVRGNDLVGRVGGDEFAVFAVNGSRQGTDALVRRLRGALNEAGVRASIGWATVEPGASAADRYREADEAMYEEKARRKPDVDRGDGA
jgi:diguanylate cyclase (GGDEF)-like protein